MNQLMKNVFVEQPWPRRSVNNSIGCVKKKRGLLKLLNALLSYINRMVSPFGNTSVVSQAV